MTSEFLLENYATIFNRREGCRKKGILPVHRQTAPEGWRLYHLSNDKPGFAPLSFPTFLSL
jgi:hypothetical protein